MFKDTALFFTHMSSIQLLVKHHAR